MATEFNLMLAGKCKLTSTGREYTDYYQLLGDTAIVSYDVAAFASGVGLDIGDAHPDDADAKLISIDADINSADARAAIVTLVYSTNISGGITYSNPLDRPPEIEWGQETVDEPIAWDFSTPAKTFVSSAGEPFDAVPTRSKGYLTCRMTRNESVSTFTSTTLVAMAYDTIVNSDTFTIDGQSVPAYYARLNITSAPKITEGTTTYYRVTYVFAFRKGVPGYTSDGWRERYEDRGRYELVSAEWVPIVDSEGRPVQKPVPLDGAGARMADDSDEGAALGPFKLYPETAFSVFSFA